MYWSNQDFSSQGPFNQSWPWTDVSSIYDSYVMTNKLQSQTYVSSLNWLLSVSLILLNARIRTIMRISWKDANSRPFFVCFSRPRYDNLPPNIICFSRPITDQYFIFSSRTSSVKNQRCPVCYISWICLSESVFNKNEALVTINKTSRSLMSHKTRSFR